MPVDKVAGVAWKEFLPKIYESGDADLIERFREAKEAMKGLPGAVVIEMVKRAQVTKDGLPLVLDKADVTESEPQKSAPEKKSPPKDNGKEQISDEDAIREAFGS